MARSGGRGERWLENRIEKQNESLENYFWAIMKSRRVIALYVSKTAKLRVILVPVLKKKNR
jgi:hypothetical protein